MYLWLRYLYLGKGIDQFYGLKAVAICFFGTLSLPFAGA